MEWHWFPSPPEAPPAHFSLPQPEPELPPYSQPSTPPNSSSPPPQPQPPDTTGGEEAEGLELQLPRAPPPYHAHGSQQQPAEQEQHGGNAQEEEGGPGQPPASPAHSSWLQLVRQYTSPSFPGEAGPSGSAASAAAAAAAAAAAVPGQGPPTACSGSAGPGSHSSSRAVAPPSATGAGLGAACQQARQSAEGDGALEAMGIAAAAAAAQCRSAGVLATAVHTGGKQGLAEDHPLPALACHDGLLADGQIDSAMQPAEGIVGRGSSSQQAPAGSGAGAAGSAAGAAAAPPLAAGGGLPGWHAPLARPAAAALEEDGSRAGELGDERPLDRYISFLRAELELRRRLWGPTGCRGLEDMLPRQQLLAGGERPAEQRLDPLASAASEQQTGSQGACIAAGGPSPSHQPGLGQQQQQQQRARPPLEAVPACGASTEVPARLQLGTRLVVIVAAQQDAPSSSMAVVHGVQVARGQVTRVAEKTAHYVYVEALLEGEAEPRPLYLIKDKQRGKEEELQRTGEWGLLRAAAALEPLGCQQLGCSPEPSCSRSGEQRGSVQAGLSQHNCSAAAPAVAPAVGPAAAVRAAAGGSALPPLAPLKRPAERSHGSSGGLREGGGRPAGQPPRLTPLPSLPALPRLRAPHGPVPLGSYVSDTPVAAEQRAGEECRKRQCSEHVDASQAPEKRRRRRRQQGQGILRSMRTSLLPSGGTSLDLASPRLPEQPWPGWPPAAPSHHHHHQQQQQQQQQHGPASLVARWGVQHGGS